MIRAFTDGSCIGNPGPGGWAYLMLNGSEPGRSMSGGEAHTTNNRMELTAAIMALRALPAGSTAEIVTDSRYVIGAARGFRKVRKMKNPDLVHALRAAADGLTLKWTWVRGHNGHRENEIVDRLANTAASRAADKAAA